MRRLGLTEGRRRLQEGKRKPLSSVGSLYPIRATDTLYGRNSSGDDIEIYIKDIVITIGRSGKVDQVNFISDIKNLTTGSKSEDSMLSQYDLIELSEY